MTNLDNILKSRDITLPKKVRLVKAMVFPVVMYGCESWSIKKAERWRIDAFELWCWRRLLGIPCTARRSNQSIQKEISPEYSLEGLMLKLKLQYFGHPMQSTDSFEKTLMLGTTASRRRRGQERLRWLDSITNSMDMTLSKLRQLVTDRYAWQTAVHRVTKSQTRLSNWAELNWYPVYQFILCDSKKKLKFCFTTRLFCCPECLHAKSFQSCSTLCDLWTVARQAPLSMGSPGKNAGVGCRALLQGIFLTLGSSPCLLWLLHCRHSSPLSQWDSPFCFPAGLYLQHPPVSKETTSKEAIVTTFVTTNFITQKIH